MTATLRSGSDYSHYAYSGYSCAGYPCAEGRQRAGAPSSVRRPRPTGSGSYAVRVPRRLSAPAAGRRGSATILHVRRRVAAALAFTGLMLLWFGAGTVLANRGDDPASVSSVRPGATHVAAPGDSLWSIAERYRGSVGIVDYVDQLAALNGGAAIDVGQVIVLP